MSSLQTVAVGLAIVFLDLGSGGWDWVADPVGWLLVIMGLAPLKELLPGYLGMAVGGWVCLLVSVLVFPPGSIDTIDPSLAWLFGIPTLGFCFLLCDGLADVTPDALALGFRVLRVAFVVVAALPFFVYLVGWDWLAVPTTVVGVATEVGLVLAVWAAGDDGEDDESGFSAERIRRRRAPAPAGPTPPVRTPPRPRDEPAEPDDGEADDDARTWWGGRKKQEQGFSAEAVRRRLRQEREAREAREAGQVQEPRDE